MKQEVARTLERLNLKPIILHEQPNGGKTLIEKFEANADVGFAVVLLSDDDRGFVKTATAKSARLRARQNVILELGYFVGKLSRKRVMALQKGDLELPSDFGGIAYTSFDSGGGWRYELVKELQAAGYTVDANKLTSPA
ncbi:MAG: nucleotide-binding protein [Planctomycetaceae bacterium]|nr:nucleotide-binding protein [Planctomycetaceae bacterium]